MAETLTKAAYTLAPDDKATLVMVYTQNLLARGEVVIKQAVRIGTWLRTQMAPEYMRLYNTQILVQGAGAMHSISLSEYYVHVSQILAFHMVPPAADPVDYDPGEPNRKMEPVTVLLGSFRLNGHVRMATASNLGKYLDTAREIFISLYEIDVSNPSIPSMGSYHVPFSLVRLNSISLGSRV